MCGDLSRERWRWLDTQHQPKKKMADYLKEKRRPKRLATMDQAFSNKREPNVCEYGNTHEPIQALYRMERAKDDPHVLL